jgi:hypothetical protein
VRISQVFPLLAATLAGCATTPVGPTGDETPLDENAPWLDVRLPLRGSIQLGDTPTVEVRGHVADDRPGLRVFVNGHKAAVDAGGQFTATVPLHDGITLLQTTATDARGNVTRDTRAVLAGPMVPVETVVRDGIVARIDARSIRAGGELLAARLGTTGFTDLVVEQNPLVNVPIPCYGARVDLSEVRHAPARVSVSPMIGGLAVDVELPQVELGMRVEYSASCSTQRVADVVATASRLRVRGMLRVGLDADGRVAFDDTGLDAELGALSFGGALPRDLGLRLADEVGERLLDLVVAELGHRLPSVILRDLGQDLVRVGDRELQLRLRATMLAFDSQGVSLVADSALSVPGGSGAVYLPSAATRPALDPGRGLAVGISDDTLNQVVATLWSTGALDRTAQATVGLADLFDAVEISVRLPPHLTALPGGEGVTVMVADVDCHLIKHRAGTTPETVARLSVTAQMRSDVRLAGQRLTLLSVQPHVIVDLLHESRVELKVFPQNRMSAVGTFVADRLLEAVGESISHLPLPASPTLTSVSGGISFAQATHGYIVVRGDRF